MFLRECHARYFIQIVDVRPERLQDITEEDCIAEGIVPHYHTVQLTHPKLVNDAGNQYAELWDSINGDSSWSSNPWVWRYKFKLRGESIKC